MDKYLAHRGILRRRRALLVLFGGVAFVPHRVRAQPARQPRIGYLLYTPITEPPSRERQAFLEGLQEQGLIPGKTVELIYGSAEGEAEFIDAVCQDLLKRGPDVIVVSGSVATLAAKKATRKIPIVMLAVGDPVGIGAVQSIARPGGNVTGVSFISTDLAPKRLQLAMQCAPGAKRLAVIWDRRNDNARSEARAALAAAPRLGLEAEAHPLASDRELATAFGRLSGSRPDLLYVTFEGGLVSANRTAIAQFGLRERVPVVSGWNFLTEAGGLLSYAPDIPAMFRRGAYYVDRVLKGASPETLPIELPTNVSLVVNLKTAKAIGVTVPRELLLRAERLIE